MEIHRLLKTSYAKYLKSGALLTLTGYTCFIILSHLMAQTLAAITTELVMHSARFTTMYAYVFYQERKVESQRLPLKVAISRYIIANGALSIGSITAISLLSKTLPPLLSGSVTILLGVTVSYIVNKKALQSKRVKE